MDVIRTSNIQTESLLAQMLLRISALEQAISAKSVEIAALQDAKVAQDRKIDWLQSDVGDLQMDIGNYSRRETELPIQPEDVD